MTSVRSVANGSRPGLAIGGGIAAGVATLAIITGIIWLAGRSSGDTGPGEGSGRIGAVVAGVGLQPGDCVNFGGSGRLVSQFTLIDCDTPHLAQITAKIEHPDAGGQYPGADTMTDWMGEQCTGLTEDFIDAPLLETTLADGWVLPDFDDWSAGDYAASCYVTSADSTPLTRSVERIGRQYPRGDEVIVSRLLVGDCFVPADDTDSYDLNSNSTVLIVSCDEQHNGIFFGRADLDSPAGTLFPGEAALGDATSRRCGQLFEQNFGVAADGFNYRYWRPNQQSWDLDDRSILCAVLDAVPMEERFDPRLYRRFFDLPTGACFNLGPEEDALSLRLDDQVRTVSCDEPHIGQMIGSGELEQDLAEPFPPDNGVEQLAGAECEQLFAEFVGISPYESELGNFPFWYPNEPGWEEGDRRFACAFVEDTPRAESLQGTGATDDG